ncbi:C6 zinc finger domain protein [Cordyceps fumosorosea ARSEF 2679]|uniref:C6 zinc finger domain protein n=1 Tax=Cordyceps fumosorosea (strain ARSEF 2679) TaxID=1081104 RepID=A0A167PLM0_CORFA|nr:C6 zinc finger domain protein [Cordyceps fumosorosea ARSEF 2679]OAA56787.1 C6 zinc finger domain protein [Cordyceps fumosorosea ARSEF 2679]
MVRQVFSDLNNFDPVSWAKESEFLCKEIAPLIGQIFHAAVCLFCTLTMPRRAVLAAYASEATSYQALRASQRRDLLGLIKEGLSKVGFANSISWPIIVVGVASGTAHDEAQGDPDYQEVLETQAFVEEQLFAAWMHPIAHVANYLLLEKLRLFWRSGKVEWDDCFYEASAC